MSQHSTIIQSPYNTHGNYIINENENGIPSETIYNNIIGTITGTVNITGIYTDNNPIERYGMLTCKNIHLDDIKDLKKYITDMQNRINELEEKVEELMYKPPLQNGGPIYKKAEEEFNREADKLKSIKISIDKGSLDSDEE
jgi:hypothetical protein